VFKYFREVNLNFAFSFLRLVRLRGKLLKGRQCQLYCGTVVCRARARARVCVCMGMVIMLYCHLVCRITVFDFHWNLQESSRVSYGEWTNDLTAMCLNKKVVWRSKMESFYPSAVFRVTS
jgi:hypothetical protein